MFRWLRETFWDGYWRGSVHVWPFYGKGLVHAAWKYGRELAFMALLWLSLPFILAVMFLVSALLFS